MISPEEGLKEVFAVPRVYKCISHRFLHFINVFGNQGGFDEILDILENGEVVEGEGLNIQVMGVLAKIITNPWPVYHKNFTQKNGKKIAQSIRKRLLQAPDKMMRDVRKE